MTESQAIESTGKKPTSKPLDWISTLSTIPLHPFLFSLIPIITSLYEVKKLALIEEIIPPIMIMECAALILLVLASLALRSIIKGSIMATLMIGLFFSYRLLAYAIEAASTAVTGHLIPANITLLIYSFLSVVCVLSAMKETWDFGKNQFHLDHKRLCQALNVISIALLIMNSISLASFEFEDEATNQKFVNQFKTAFDGVKLNESAAKPDIYYFIVDGFASKYTMSDMYHTQDDQLFDFLKEKNFYVVPEARSNYDRTEYSLSSLFNMQYIDALPNTYGKNYDGLNVFCRMIQDSASLRMLKKLGYKFVNVSSGTSATDWVYTADVNIRQVPFNHFTTAVALLTPLYETEKYYPIMRDLLADMRLAPGKSIQQVVNIPGPKFVLIHTEVAHAPCLFDENGKRLPLPEGQYMINWGTPKELSGQWKFAQKKVVEWMTNLLDLTQGKSIIVIQSDHGSGIPEPKYEDWYNERMRILNALYLPGKNGERCYKTMTPVNNMRVVFDDYFDAKLPMLPDDSWCPPVYTKPFEWINVKDKVRFPH